jgi:N-acetylmuramic acid 6-phosphate etherase
MVMFANTPDDLPITEQENPRTRDIGSRSIADIIQLIADEDALVAPAVARELPDVALAVDGIVARLERGGRLFYIGAGTSGRLGVLDASECPPTFGVPPDLVQGIIAGGYDACYRAVEASEDDGAAGARDIDACGMTNQDAVVGIAASGRTPYVLGALARGRAIGAFTVAVACVPGSGITRVVDVAIVPVVGPEALAGSTRMKAGTAQKLVLNMLSTATMIRLGYVSGNRMTHMRPRNTKLRARAVRILRTETGVGQPAAEDALDLANGDLASALVMLQTGRSREEASRALDRSRGVVSRAVRLLASRDGT